MRDFVCPLCGQRLAFENLVCRGCGSNLGFDIGTRTFAVLTVDGIARGTHTDRRGAVRSWCANREEVACNWLATPPRAALDTAARCLSCALTRARPSATDLDAMPAFARAEAAKRRLLFGLIELGLPVHGFSGEPQQGLCFDLLPGAGQQVTPAQADGVIRLALAEDDGYGEQRVTVPGSCGTPLGRLRHDVGHFYYHLLAETDHARPELEAVFCDAEDWAETFAYYLQIRDVLDTTATFGLASADALATTLVSAIGFARVVDLWLPLAWSLTVIDRAMRHPDLHPSTSPPADMDKVRLIHRLVTGASHE